MNQPEQQIKAVFFDKNFCKVYLALVINPYNCNHYKAFLSCDPLPQLTAVWSQFKLSLVIST